MNTRFALTPAIGLFTGAMVSFGALSMFLTGVHGSPSTATNPCAAGKTNAAQVIIAHRITTRARSATSARHVSHLPAVLDATARAISGPHAAAATSSAQGSAIASSSPAPSTHPSLGPPVTPSPSPGGGMVTPSPGNTPQPGNSTIVTPGQHARPIPTISPGGTNVTPTSSPTPTSATPTPTSTAPTATLCLTVQTVGSSTVKPGSTVQFDVVVWLTSGTGGKANLSLTVSPSSIKPTFTVCQAAGKSTCTVPGLKAGQHLETQAQLTASKTYGTAITLTVNAASAEAVKSVSATDKIQVEAKPQSSPSPTPTTNNTGTNPGNGGSLPTTPGLPGSNYNYPGVTNPAGSLGSAFPTVAPSPNATAQGPGQHQHQIKALDLSAGLPLTVRLIGGQVIGLAILAAAVTIAVARLSLRRQSPKHSDDSAGSTPAS